MTSSTSRGGWARSTRIDRSPTGVQGRYWSPGTFKSGRYPLSGMELFRDWWETAKQVIMQPKSFFADAEPMETGVSLKFAATSFFVEGVILSILVLLLSAFGGAGMPGLVVIPIYLIALPLIGAVMMVVAAAFIHIVVYFLDGRGYDDTLAAVCYATPVQALFGWIPFVNLLAGLYLLYVQIRGVEAFHDFSFGRAALAVLLIPAIAFLIGIIAVIGMFASMPMGPA